MSELTREDFERLLFEAFKRKEEKGKDAVLLVDFGFELQTRSGKSLSSLSEKEEKALNEAIDALINSGIIRYENMRGGIFLKGINFRNWYREMEGSRKETQAVQVSVNAQSINAPVAVGGRDVHQRVANTEELMRVLEILEKLIENPDKGKDLLEEIKKSINSGSITTAMEFVDHLISLARSLGLG